MIDVAFAPSGHLPHANATSIINLYQVPCRIYFTTKELFLYKRPGGDESIPGMNQTHSHDQNFRDSFPECFANLFRNNSKLDDFRCGAFHYYGCWASRLIQGKLQPDFVKLFIKELLP